MQRKTREQHTSRTYPLWEPFNIERRIFVGRIEPSPDGQTGPVQAAFLAIADYMADNDDPQGYDVSFEVFGRSFRAQLEPDPKWLEQQLDPRNPWSQEA